MIMDPTQTKSTEDSPMGPGFTGGTLLAVGLIKKINELTKHEDLLDGLVAFKELEAGLISKLPPYLRSIATTLLV